MDNVTADLEAIIAGNRSSLLMPSDSESSADYTKLERLLDRSRRLSDEGIESN